jgi:hypothetical protein
LSPIVLNEPASDKRDSDEPSKIELAWKVSRVHRKPSWRLHCLKALALLEQGYKPLKFNAGFLKKLFVEEPQEATLCSM